MHDDTWWDGEDDGDAIAELQRVLAPLREAPRPWGDVIAQARFVERGPTRRGPLLGGLTIAIAAALVLTWGFGRRDDASDDLIEHVKPPVEVQDLVVAAPPTVPDPMDDPFVQLDLSVLRLDLFAEEYEFHERERARKQAEEDRRAALRRRLEQDDAVKRLLEHSKEIEKSGGLLAQDDELPDTLTTNDIKVAMDRIKPAAKACGVKHGAAKGEKVKIKLSIAGATGRPTSVNALDDHQDTALGDCIVELVKTARFPRFRKPALGVIYPFSM